MVPVTVTGFDSIGSIGFWITYDHSKIQFRGLSNANSNLTGIMQNDIGQTLRIAWADAGIEGVNFGNTKLFDLKFKLLGGMTTLCFDTKNSSVSNYYTLNDVPVVWYCGKVDDVTTGIVKVKNNEENLIYPNPTDGHFYVTFKKGDIGLNLYNANGELVMSQNISNSLISTPYMIDIPNLPKGIYIIRIQGNVNTYKKLIIY